MNVLITKGWNMFQDVLTTTSRPGIPPPHSGGCHRASSGPLMGRGGQGKAGGLEPPEKFVAHNASAVFLDFGGIALYSAWCLMTAKTYVENILLIFAQTYTVIRW